MHLLFVCTGNVCRSPLAERLTAAFVEQRGTADLTVGSAGIRALSGEGMDADAAAVLRELGGSPDGFRARPFTPALADRADLVLTMGRRHRVAVLERSPRAMRRTFTLREAAGVLASLPADERPSAVAVHERGAEMVAALARHRGRWPGNDDAADIRDPYRRGPEVHAEVGHEIVRSLLPLLRELAGDGSGTALS